MTEGNFYVLNDVVLGNFLLILCVIFYFFVCFAEEIGNFFEILAITFSSLKFDEAILIGILYEIFAAENGNFLLILAIEITSFLVCFEIFNLFLIYFSFAFPFPFYFFIFFIFLITLLYFINFPAKDFIVFLLY